MTVEQFLEILRDNRDLLSTPDSNCGDENGCPLWVGLFVGCMYYERCLCLFANGLPCNPDPDEAAVYLKLDPVFTKAVSDAWDMGFFYGDAEASDDWARQFAGYLVGITLRPASYKPYQYELTAG